MSTAQICGQFGISRQAHYQKRLRESQRYQDNQIILEMVRQVRRKHPRMGVRKLHDKIDPMLAAEGCKIGRDRLFELLREENLLVRPKKTYHRTTIPGVFRAPNRLPGLIISRPNQVWVCDITYLKLRMGRFAYLFVLMDLYARYIVGWYVSASLASDGAVTGLEMALACLPEHTPSLIHHSDHGVQYTSHIYMNTLVQHRILSSMGAVGNCYDNAFAERLIGTLKNEYLLDTPFASIGQVVSAVKEVVYLYNTDRPHLSLNMGVPIDVYRGNCQEVPVVEIPGVETANT
jgi:transposase InsO family protein